VVFSACAPTAGSIRQRGYEVTEFRGVDPIWRARDVNDIYDAYESLGFADWAVWAHLIKYEMELVRRARPDIIVTHMRPMAVIAARASGVPVVSLASVGSAPRTQSRKDRHILDDISASLSEEYLGEEVPTFPHLIYDISDAKIATSFPEFEPELASQPDVDFVGYLSLQDSLLTGAEVLPPVPDRLVLVYLSTAGWASPAMVKTLETSANLTRTNIWCVTTANGPVGRLSERVRLFNFLPIDALLPKVRCMIFHGGQGSALASIYHGVPTIACPGKNWERAYNAARIASLGCGKDISMMDLRPRRLSAHLREAMDMLDSPALTHARDRLRSFSGAEHSVTILERTRGGVRF
jgi:hypothetical protein